ncbi:MAG: hypothetical protein ACXIU7_07570 [Roseinatronobacter sp.]
MTSLNTNVTRSRGAAHLTAQLRAIGNGLLNLLVAIAAASPRYQAIEYYNSLSDEDLAKMGMTRADVVQRVFGARSYL